MVKNSKFSSSFVFFFFHNKLVFTENIRRNRVFFLLLLQGVVKFDPKSGKQMKSKSETLSYTQYFAESLIAEAEQDDKIIGIHAAMGGGTGLNLFQKRFPDRCFDVGIAEQHAVTFAAGLAAEGLKPFCAIYSSFLQRGFDQVIETIHTSISINFIWLERPYLRQWISGSSHFTAIQKLDGKQVNSY